MKGIALLPVLALLTMGPTARAEPADRTIIKDRAAFERLIGNSGLTLQWIGWDRRGDVEADYRSDLLHLHGEQGTNDGPGKLLLDGVVTEVGRDYFRFDGRIDIVDSPDRGRNCHREGPMTFRITQNRKYWRLQAMEACDGLTDYVDIYF